MKLFLNCQIKTGWLVKLFWLPIWSGVSLATFSVTKTTNSVQAALVIESANPSWTLPNISLLYTGLYIHLQCKRERDRDRKREKERERESKRDRDREREKKERERESNTRQVSICFCSKRIKGKNIYRVGRHKRPATEFFTLNKYSTRKRKIMAKKWEG